MLKLETTTERPQETKVSAEWDTGWPGPEVIVEVHEVVTEYQISNNITNSTVVEQGPKLVVRPEEALIVLFVLILWVCAIGLFFHRWGKIRMLEPYQPKFQQQHRTSCPLVDLEPIAIPSTLSQQRTSFSKMGMSFQNPSTSGSSAFLRGGGIHYPGYSRTRQNSVFVGPQSIVSPPQPPRKTRSAVDIHSLILSETDCDVEAV